MAQQRHICEQPGCPHAQVIARYQVFLKENPPRQSFLPAGTHLLVHRRSIPFQALYLAPVSAINCHGHASSKKQLEKQLLSESQNRQYLVCCRASRYVSMALVSPSSSLRHAVASGIQKSIPRWS